MPALDCIATDDAGTGRDWLECTCGRWIHEECVDFTVCDIKAQENLSVYTKTYDLKSKRK